MKENEWFRQEVEYAIRELTEPVVYSSMNKTIDRIEKILIHVRHNVLSMGFADCPMTDQRLQEIKELIANQSDYWIGRHIFEIVRELLNLVAWCFSRINIMAQDNGYQEGFQAGIASQEKVKELEEKVNSLAHRLEMSKIAVSSLERERIERTERTKRFILDMLVR